MRFLILPAMFLCGSIGVSADAAPLRHNNVKNISKQIQQLPVIDQQYVVPKSEYTAPAPLKTVESLPQSLQLEKVVEVPSVTPLLIQPEVSEQNAALLDLQPSPQPTPLRSVASLSPKTQTLIDDVKPGIGLEKSAPKKIVIKAGGFDEDAQDGPGIDEEGFEEVGEVESSSPAFEVKVTKKKPAFNVHENLVKAERALKFDQFESAITLYRSVLKDDPKNLDASFGLATAYQKMGRKNRAKEVYGEILDKHPKYEPALNNLLALARSEAPERALEEFATIEEKSPNFASVYAQKAKIYREQLNLSLAVKNLRTALEIEPSNNVYRYDLAILEDERGSYGEAAALYAELVKAANDGQEIPADKELIVDRMNYVSSIE